MPILLSDLLSETALRSMLADGYIRERSHPSLPLRIFNYAEKAQYERAWTHETRTCRGLIVHHDGTIVARSWPKFFNYGEHEQGHLPPLDLTARVDVTDKMDGSLGILYPWHDGHGIATRGSFVSEQAVHATDLYRSTYADEWEPDPDLTYLFEIIYAGNRIVLDYGDSDDLVLLGAVETETGLSFGPLDERVDSWPGPRTTAFDHLTLADALAAEPRPNAEGLVVRFLDGSGLMVKIKQDDYVLLHKLITGLSEKAVWEHLSSGADVSELLESIPDEFHAWVIDKANRLSALHAEWTADVDDAYRDVLAALPDGWERKDFAIEAMRRPEVRPFLFNRLDGKDPSPGIWKILRPVGETYMLGITEDVA